MKKKVNLELYNSIEINNDDVANRLRNLREKHSYSCEDIAIYLDINTSSYRKYEEFSSNTLPKNIGLLKLAKLYNVSIEYILTGYTNDSDLLNDKFDSLKSLLAPLDSTVQINFMEHIIEMLKALK